MREVDLDNLTGKDLIDHAAISEAFKKYLMEVLEYDEGEADFVVSTDFENPYNTPFIMQDFDLDVAIIQAHCSTSYHDPARLSD